MRHDRVLGLTALGVCLALTGLTSSSAGATGLAATASPGTAQPAASCSYPPVRTPALTLTSSVTSVKPLVNFTLSGALKVNACGLKNWPIGLFTSTSTNGPFILVGVTTTNGSGQYSFGYAQSVTRSYRTSSAAGAGYNAALSNIVTVTKK